MCVKERLFESNVEFNSVEPLLIIVLLLLLLLLLLNRDKQGITLLGGRDAVPKPRRLRPRGRRLVKKDFICYLRIWQMSRSF